MINDAMKLNNVRIIQPKMRKRKYIPNLYDVIVLKIMSRETEDGRYLIEQGIN